MVAEAAAAAAQQAVPGQHALVRTIHQQPRRHLLTFCRWAGVADESNEVDS